MAIDGGPDLIQLLTPEGVLMPHPHYRLDLDDEGWRSRYEQLVTVRRLDAEATALQRHGELGLWAPCQGQEAAQVGAALATRPTDRIFPTYREHGMAYVRGVDPVTLLGLFRGTTLGGWDPAEHGFSLYTIVIGDQTLHAVGYAMGIQRDGTDDAVLVCFGDGASSQGDVSEAFVFAAVNDAPVVFFCQNNQWAISEPLERQTRIPLYRRAAGYGFPGVRVDGNDVLACLAVGGIALDAARAAGYRRFFVVLTRERGYVKSPLRSPWLFRRRFRAFPAITDALVARPARYNAVREELFDLERSGDAYLFVPQQMGIANSERDVAKLEAAHARGLAQARAEEPAWRRFLGI